MNTVSGDSNEVPLGARGAARHFTAAAFWPSLAEGRIPGRLSFDAREARFSSEHGDCALDLAAVELRLGGANDRLVFLSDPKDPASTVFTADMTVLDEPALLKDQRLAEAVSQLRRKRSWQRALLLAVPVGLVLLVLGLWFSRDAIVNVVVRRIPPSVEVRVGDLAAGQLIAPQQIHDAQLQDLLEQLVASLEAVASDQYQYTFALVEDSSINAFALPGGRAALHTGLILEATSLSEIQGVLAHEMAHVQQRHSLRNMASSAGLFLVVQTVLGDLSGLLAVAADGGLSLATLRFSRDFEREADDIGLDLLQAANIDPWGLPLFLEKLQASHEDAGGAVTVISETLDFLSTHPASQERIDRLEQRLAEMAVEPRRVGSGQVELVAFQTALRQYLGSEQTANADEVD